MMTPLELNHLGYRALLDALGFDGMSVSCGSLNQGKETKRLNVSNAYKTFR